MRLKHFFWIGLIIWWPLRAQQNTDYFEWGRQMELIAAVMEQVLNNYVETPNAEQLGTDAIKGMLKHTDRYTRFYDEQQMFDQRLRQSGHVSGIGVRVRAVDGGLQIREVLHDTPARKAGLMPGDTIVAIDSTFLQGLSAAQKDRLIKGKPGTDVHLLVKRGHDTLSFNIRRRMLDRKAVPYAAMLDDRTGYIRLRKFSKGASREVQDALVDLKNQGARQIILDLRGNPGGLLSEAINTVNLFIPKGKLVVETKGRLEKFNRKYFTKRSAIDEDIPLTVLINNRSASASEIVSGTLQDYDRARILGDTSYGKGLVQRFFPLKYGTYVKITISKYYLPSGRSIQKRDYWHRDREGKVTRYRADTTAFFTEKGRKVYEHGGIAPDIFIPSDTLMPEVKYLSVKDLLFGFTVDYIRRHKAPASPAALDEHRLADQYISYAARHHLPFKTLWIEQLEKALETARSQKASATQLADLEQTLKRAEKEAEARLRRGRAHRQLGILLKRLLIQHYWGDRALAEYDVKNSPVVKRAAR